jgi:hypothetical protein
LFHDQGVVEMERHEEKGVLLAGRLPGRLAAMFRPYLVKDKSHAQDQIPQEKQDD